MAGTKSLYHRHYRSPPLTLLVTVSIQANPTAYLNPSNHQNKPNKSKIHEQSNTFSTNISKINILFENLTRKMERSKRFGFENWEIQSLTLNDGDSRSIGVFGGVMVVGEGQWWLGCPTWYRSGDGGFRYWRSRGWWLTALACLVVVKGSVGGRRCLSFVLFYFILFSS